LADCPESISPNRRAEIPANRPGSCLKTMYASNARQYRGFRSLPNRRIIASRLISSRNQDLLEESFQGNFPALGQPIDELALAEIKGAILAKLRLAIGKDAGMATRHDWYKAAALALRDRIVHHWLTADKQSYDAGAKWVHYHSL